MATIVIPTRSESMPEKDQPCEARVDSWRINVPDERWLVERIIQDIAEGQGGTVFTINLDHLSKLRTDDDFRAAYERASYITADGMPVVMLARAEGVNIDRVTGADLVRPLCRAAAEAGVAVHFFGTSDDVLTRAASVLEEEIPGLKIAGTEAPPMGFDPHGNAARDAACRIVASGAKICFVALGAPKQEFFANTAISVTEGVVYLGVGAALDFIAGHRRRAPLFLQRTGMEWLWLALQEPRRMVPRYVRSAAWLIGYVARNLFGMVHHERSTPVEVASDQRTTLEDLHLRLPMGSRELGR